MFEPIDEILQAKDAFYLALMAVQTHVSGFLVFNQSPVSPCRLPCGPCMHIKYEQSWSKHCCA